MTSGDFVVDVGAGTGVLTRALADAGAEVIALELDSGLAADLRRRFAAHRRVAVIEVDVLDWEWPKRPFAVVANLPFAGGGAILGHLLRDPRGALRRADVIVQWGFAEKHTAVWPSTLRSTYWRAWYEVSITSRLARTSFSPVPSVDAAMVRIVQRSPSLVPPQSHDEYWQFLCAAFRSQSPLRRALRGRIAPVRLKGLAPTLGFSTDAHARDLDARQWAALFAALDPT